MKKKEVTRRLSPTKDVLRALFARSGNQCAFPDCEHELIDEDDNFVGQVCHIEAAAEGGERFNPNMTNEERRQASNLLLLCYKHHVKSNDTVKFTKEVLITIKQNQIVASF